MKGSEYEISLQLNSSSLRLGALRDSSLILLDRLNSSPHFNQYLPYLFPCIKSLVRASPDLEIRQKFIVLVDKLIDK